VSTDKKALERAREAATKALTAQHREQRRIAEVLRCLACSVARGDG